jgi:hypothetical protein
MKICNIAVDLLPAQGANPLTIVSVPVNREVRLIELQTIVKVSSIEEIANYAETNAFMTPEEKDELFWRNALEAEKIGLNSSFSIGQTSVELINFLIFNRQPYYSDNLLSRYTSREDLYLQGGASLQIAAVDVGYGLLTGSDRITVWGTYELSDPFYE